MVVEIAISAWDRDVRVEVDPNAVPELRFANIDQALEAARIPVFTALGIGPLIARAIGYFAVDPFLSHLTYVGVPHVGTFRVSVLSRNGGL